MWERESRTKAYVKYERREKRNLHREEKNEVDTKENESVREKMLSKAIICLNNKI